MPLSNDLISLFVKSTKDDTKAKTEKTVYGTIVEYDGSKYVKMDGSELLTPIAVTTNVQNGERVTVLIKNHTATVTGNLTAPSASNREVYEIGDKITEMEVAIADKVDTIELNAVNGRIDSLRSDVIVVKDTLTANNAAIKNLEAEDLLIKDELTARKADIEELEAEDIKINGKLDANDADIKSLQTDNLVVREQLTAHKADIDRIDADNVIIHNSLVASSATIQKLQTEKLSATDADLKYVNIDFANIDEAWFKELYSESGLIQYVTSEGITTGHLVGVTIKGDIIEGGTVKADKLVVQGEDGLYYKLNTDGVTVEAEQTEYNSLDGSVITAKSITATKIRVDDLVAFDATIGGFKITNDAIHSVVKESVENTTRGIYIDNEGQTAIGDSNNFIKYHKIEQEDGSYIYRMEVSADIIQFGSEYRDLQMEFENVHLNISNGRDDNTLNAERIEQAILEIDNLKKTISTLVTGQNGESLMIQTENGWQFNMKTILDTLDSNVNDIDVLTADMNNSNEKLKVLDQAVIKLGEYTEYIQFSVMDGHPCILLGELDSSFKVIIKNTGIDFMEGTQTPLSLSQQSVNLKSAVIEGEIRQGGFAWTVRSDGHYGLYWRSD